MFRRAAGYLLASAVLLHSRFASADTTCPGFPCEEVAVKYQGGAQTCGVDPEDDGYFLAIYAFCPCVDQTPVLALTFTQNNGQVSTFTSTGAPITSATTVVFESASISQAYNNLLDGAIVTAGGPLNTGYLSFSYTYEPMTSLFYTTFTTTTTATSTVTTTATVTAQSSVTATIAQSTQTIPCTTGTVTSIARTSTITSLTTIPNKTATTTLPPKITTVTVTNPCPYKGRRHIEQRQAQPFYEEPFCSPRDGTTPAPTTSTSTQTATATTTTTQTDTATVTATSTITVTQNPATTTVCSNVAASTTVHPTITTTKSVGGTTSYVTTRKTSTHTTAVTPSNCKTKSPWPPHQGPPPHWPPHHWPPHHGWDD